MTDNNSAPELLAVVGNLLRQHKLGGWPVTDQQWKALDEAYRRRADLCAADRGVTETCPDCKGLGRWGFADGGDTCEQCSGRGTIAALQPTEAGARVDELATIIRMLVRHVPNDKQIKGKAVDYLCRHGLQGSPLREDATPSTDNAALVEAVTLILRADRLRDVYHSLPNDKNRIGDKRSRKSHARDAWLRAFRKAARVAGTALASREAPPAVTVDAGEWRFTPEIQAMYHEAVAASAAEAKPPAPTTDDEIVASAAQVFAERIDAVIRLGELIGKQKPIIGKHWASSRHREAFAEMARALGGSN